MNDWQILENISCAIKENKNNLTLKELTKLYGEDYIPPYFVICAGGRLYPFSYHWKELLVKLDYIAGEHIRKQKENLKGVKNDCSRTWKNNDKKIDKIIASQIFR